MRKISSPRPLPLCLLPEIPPIKGHTREKLSDPLGCARNSTHPHGGSSTPPGSPLHDCRLFHGALGSPRNHLRPGRTGSGAHAAPIPDQAAILDASTTWHPRLVILLACTPTIAGFMGLSGGLIGLLTPADIVASSPELMKIASPEALKYIGYGRTTIAVTMAILGWFVLHLGYARHYQRLATSDGYGLEVPGSRDATAPAGNVHPPRLRKRTPHLRRANRG